MMAVFVPQSHEWASYVLKNFPSAVLSSGALPGVTFLLEIFYQENEKMMLPYMNATKAAELESHPR